MVLLLEWDLLGFIFMRLNGRDGSHFSLNAPRRINSKTNKQGEGETKSYAEPPRRRRRLHFDDAGLDEF